MPLRYLVLDFNAFFASVEQQDRPALRGRPVGVVPTLAETSCCIAASYEAKRRGVTTGTLVREARRLCPGIQILPARPSRYLTVHRRCVEAVESVLPVTTVLSIDEMSCRLVGPQQEPGNAVRLVQQIKATLAEAVGPVLTSSVGVAPNVLLAKVASDLQKPNGLVVIRSEDLPEFLYRLKVTDFPGIASRMERRLQRAGVATVEQFCALTLAQQTAVWGSRIVGERWWRRLRGEDVVEPPERRRSLGHSRVLPPALRNDADARGVAGALLHKAAARLRRTGYWAGSLTLTVDYQGGGTWHECRNLDPCQDTLTFLRVLAPLWECKPAGQLLKVGVVFGHLVEGKNVPPPLFPEDRRLNNLARAMDAINARFGKYAVRFGGMLGAEGEDPLRIAFDQIPDME